MKGECECSVGASAAHTGTCCGSACASVLSGLHAGLVVAVAKQQKRYYTEVHAQRKAELMQDFLVEPREGCGLFEHVGSPVCL